MDTRRYPAGVPTQKRTRIIIAAIGAISLAMLIALGLQDTTTVGDRAAEDCRSRVAARLTAPSTARWTDPAITDWRGGNWRVRGQVEADNAFGVPISHGYECQLHTPDGGNTWVANRVTVD